MVHGKETETGSYITLEWICNVADGWLAQARIFRLIKTLSAAGGLIRTLDITSASSATGGTAVQRGSLFHVIELRACPKTFSVVQNPASGFQSGSSHLDSDVQRTRIATPASRVTLTRTHHLHHGGQQTKQAGILIDASASLLRGWPWSRVCSTRHGAPTLR